jgi:DNA-binding PadR family transcriptional regulator
MSARQTSRDPESFLPLKPALFHILLALSERDLHGYGIMKEVEEITGGRIALEPSPLYRRLKRLLNNGIVTESGERPAPELDDRRRRYYRLTQLGHRILSAEAARMESLVASERIRALAARAGSS